MIDLMKIDILKFNLKKQPFYFLLANMLMAALAFAILSTGDALVESAPIVIDVLVKPVFVIWEAVLIATVIIDEFKSKTILMLYTYPVDKKKLIISKVLVVLLYSISGIIGSQILLNILFFGINKVFPHIPYELSWNQVVAYTVSSIMVILLGLIPLCVGLVKYSTIAAIVSSVMIVIMGSSSGLGFDQLLSQISVVSVMGMIGVTGTVISISKMFQRDIIV